jgi:hypothetical protein
MLPGFRFLFAAIVLSMSMLVFGLGAAALLRAAHEEFASTPSWHPPPETVFTQQAEATGPVLAMLHVDPPGAISPAAAPAQQPATISMPAETESTAAPPPQDPLPPEVAKPEAPVAESPAQDESTPAPAVSPTAAEETKMAVSEPTLPPASEAAPAAPEQANVPAPADANVAATKIAALDSPSTNIEAQPPAKTAVAKHEKNSIRKRMQARRATRNRRIALRARVAQQAAQQLADPFAQPSVTGRRR